MSSNLIYSPSAARVLNSIPSNEHTAGDRTPYCYLIGWTKQNLWYYGRRTAEGCHPSEFWKKYFTSCKESNDSTVKTVWTCLQDYGEPDIKKIVRVFYSRYDCASWENRFLLRVNAAKNPRFLNRTNGDKDFDNTGKVHVIDNLGNTITISVDDERYLSGELIPYTKNKVACVDSHGNSFYISKDDPRYVSGELKSVSTDTKLYIDSNGVMYRLTQIDPLIDEKNLVLFDLKKHRQELSQREEVKRLLAFAKSKQISLSASVRWTIDLSPVWEFVKKSPCGSRYGTRSGKQSQKEVEDRAENIKALRNRPEVLYLKEIANQRNIKLKPYWEWKNDISEIRDIILNGPANVSYATKKKKSSEI